MAKKAAEDKEQQHSQNGHYAASEETNQSKAKEEHSDRSAAEDSNEGQKDEKKASAADNEVQGDEGSQGTGAGSGSEQEVNEYKDKFLRLYSEFENFRRRTSREKADFLKTANEGLIKDLLPVLDDFERALKSMEEADDTSDSSVKEGVELIYNKFHNVLKNKGLTPIEAMGETFDTEVHEAVTQIPAPSEDMKGKVVDEVEKGYYLGEKVIRFSKVIIGS